MDQGHFDYKVVSEESDDLDFGKLVPCPHCKKPIPQDATMCLYCGKETVYRQKNPWFMVIVVITIIAFLFLIIKSI